MISYDPHQAFAKAREYIGFASSANNFYYCIAILNIFGRYDPVNRENIQRNYTELSNVESILGEM